jgi:hypothetical protein
LHKGISGGFDSLLTDSFINGNGPLLTDKRTTDGFIASITGGICVLPTDLNATLLLADMLHYWRII